MSDLLTCAASHPWHRYLIKMLRTFGRTRTSLLILSQPNLIPKKLGQRVGIVASAIIICIKAKPHSICEPPKHSFLIENANVDHNDSIVSDYQESLFPMVIQSLSDAFIWLWSCFRVTYRCCKLCLTFAPAIMSLPIALVFPSDLAMDWWWSLFRYSICAAGPTFIKLSQVLFSF